MPRQGLAPRLRAVSPARDLHVIIAGRTSARLDAVVAEIKQAGGSATALVADATREADMMALLDEAGSHGSLDLVAYNVGNAAMIPSLDMSGAQFETMWRQNALGGFLVGREAVRRMLPQGHGTIIFTGATASLRARPPFIAFASAKAALRAVAQGLAREFGPQGIHVAHVVIDGVIHGDQALSKSPDFVKAKGKDGLLEPDDDRRGLLDLALPEAERVDARARSQALQGDILSRGRADMSCSRRSSSRY